MNLHSCLNNWIMIMAWLLYGPDDTSLRQKFITVRIHRMCKRSLEKLFVMMTDQIFLSSFCQSLKICQVSSLAEKSDEQSISQNLDFFVSRVCLWNWKPGFNPDIVDKNLSKNHTAVVVAQLVSGRFWHQRSAAQIQASTKFHLPIVK